MPRLVVAAILTFLVGGVAYRGLRPRQTPRERHRISTTPSGAVMSLDIFFHTCNLGTRRLKSRNPFTGEPMERFDDPGLTGPERAAVADLLHRASADGPDEDGSYHVRFDDGGDGDLLAPGLSGGARFDSCSVGAHELTSDLVDFLFRLSVTGNMMIVPAMRKTGTLVTSEAQRQAAAARYPDARVVRTPRALGEELRRGSEDQNRYRDQVIGGEE
jgi:hypothetical protein